MVGPEQPEVQQPAAGLTRLLVEKELELAVPDGQLAACLARALPAVRQLGAYIPGCRAASGGATGAMHAQQVHVQVVS